jgi:hypothetical protein
MRAIWRSWRKARSHYQGSRGKMVATGCPQPHTQSRSEFVLHSARIVIRAKKPSLYQARREMHTLAGERVLHINSGSQA